MVLLRGADVTIFFYISFAMVSAVMFAVGALIAYIEGEKELKNRYYNRGRKNNGKNQKKHSA